MPYKLLNHTADARVECRGSNLEELLESAAQALYAVAFRRIQPGKETEHTVQIRPQKSSEDLLVRWLQELIYLMDVENFVACEFYFDRAGPDGIRAKVRGYTYEPQEREAEVKAATYHGMEIRHERGELVTQVIFDL